MNPIFKITLLMLVLVSCTSDNLSDTPNLLEISFSLGDNLSATAQWHGANSLTTQALVDDISDSQIDLLPTGSGASALSVTNITHNGLRYLSATFEFTNNTGGPLTDMYFIPVDTDNTFAGTETLGNSEFAALVDFTNSPILTLPTGMTSAAAKVYDPTTDAVLDASYNDFVTPLDVSSLPPQTGLSYKAYGFLAHTNDRSSTTISSGGNGRITVAAELSSSTTDPFKFSMLFEVVRDAP